MYLLFDCVSALPQESDFESKETDCLSQLNAGFEPWKSETPNPSRLISHWPTDWYFEDQAKTQQPIPMSEHAYANAMLQQIGIRLDRHANASNSDTYEN